MEKIQLEVIEQLEVIRQAGISYYYNNNKMDLLIKLVMLSNLTN